MKCAQPALAPDAAPLRFAAQVKRKPLGSRKDLHNYVYKHDVTSELRFNIEYFTKNLTQADADALLRSGNFEIEFYLNGPESARLAQELIAQMGGTIARYDYPKGVPHEVQIILTAVTR